jgi:hypothetical protein
MSISRRKFLRAGTLVALSAALPISVFGQSRKENDGNPTDQQPIPYDPLAQYNRSAFASYLNSIFQLYAGYSVVAVTLVEVKDLQPAATAADGRECFSLLFRGGSAALTQNTYRIDHPSLGSFNLFLVPGGPDSVGAQSYVAIINRISYSDALNSVPSRLSKPTDRIRPDEPLAPAAPPRTTTPAPTNTPIEKPKPSRRRKPSWKSGDNEDPEGGIDQ